MNKLHLPSLRGRLGDWTYFSTIMKVKDIVHNHRIITVSESDELYSKNINEILQREIDKKRINKISNYLINQKEHFFSSIIVAIHKGNPEWSDVDLESQFKIKNEEIEEDNFNFIENKFGILTLNGNEEIFALDGQHRLVGLRDALEKDKELGEEEVSLVYVVHNQENKERTRRLFTVLNRYAEKPKKAELIILEEDDVAAINARRLVTHYKNLSKPNSLSTTKSGSIPTNDYKSFTTLVTVYNINTELYPKNGDFYRSRPDKKKIEEFYKKSVKFWDFVFEVFPELIDFIDEKQNVKIYKAIINRNIKTGGSLLLRPEGQKLFAQIYKHFSQKNKLKKLKDNIRKVDLNLSGKHLNYLFWNNGKMMQKELRLKKYLILFLLGEFDDIKYINQRMKEVYSNFNVEYKPLTPVI